MKLARLAAVALIGLAEAGAIYWAQHQRIDLLAESARGVVVGVPHWRIYQSRVLGPFLIEAWRLVTGMSFRASFLVVMAALIGLKNYAVYFACRDFRGTGLCETLIGAVLFVLLQNSWLYPWDPIDIAVSAGIIGLAARPTRSTVPLFLVALLNRESSVFVGLFLIIDSVVVRAEHGMVPLRLRLAQPSRLAAGLGMIAFSVVVVEALRRLLLVRPVFTAPPNGLLGSAVDGSAQWQVQKNLRDLIDSLRGPDAMPATELALVLLVLLVFIGSRIRSTDLRLQKLAILAALELVSIGLFGVLSELRVFSGIVPFVALFLATSSAISAPGRKTDA